MAAHPAETWYKRAARLRWGFLTFADRSKRTVLEDAPLVGTGAGTFAALAPIYREIDDPPPDPLAATAAAAFAIELGKPMFWLIAAATAGCIFILLRASLHRGRDSFYPAMGGSCLITLLLLSFNNAGLFGTASSSIAAAVIGLAIAQSKSSNSETLGRDALIGRHRRVHSVRHAHNHPEFWILRQLDPDLMI